MNHYKAALPYRDMIAGIGLDSNEYRRPPLLFQEVFSLARRDGFRITMHCDVGQDNTHEHIRQVAGEIGGYGTDRIDHGLNAVESQELLDTIRKKGLGMTICPWSYIRHQPPDEVFESIRMLIDQGVKISIASDDPAFMEDTWLLENLLALKKFCRLTNDDLVRLQRDAVEMSWASEETKTKILEELNEFAKEAA